MDRGTAAPTSGVSRDAVSGDGFAHRLGSDWRRLSGGRGSGEILWAFCRMIVGWSQQARTAHRDPLFWVLGVALAPVGYFLVMVSLDALWPHEVHIAPPRAETIMPVSPGQDVVVRWHTRIMRACAVTYSRRLERDDGLTYQLGTHRGSYTQPSGVGGKVFKTTFRVPLDAPPGHYVYVVTTDVECSPVTHYAVESPRVPVEVR